MNFTQRAMLYISRKKGKTVSLFLVVFVVAVFLISCFGVLNASERLSRDIRISLGAAFYIRANTEVQMNENGETEVKENNIHIVQKEIDEIMQTGEIKYYNPINYGFAKSDVIQFIPGDKHTKESNMGKVTALRFSALAPNFTDETAVLTEGKHITEADKGKILISEQLANANKLSVGDTLTLTHAKLGEADGAYIDEIPVKTAYAQVEVLGIYKLNTPDTAIKPTAGVADNEIYASLDVLNELHESETGVYTGEVDFYITDPAKLESITRNVQILQSIDWTTHFIRTNDFQYSKITDQLSSLSDLVKILLVLVSVVSTAFLTLLLTMRMRSRMQETGILLSVGVSKGQIIGGLLLEVLSVTIIALVLSYITSLCVTGFLGHSLFGELQPNLINEETITAGMQNSLQIENYLKLSAVETLFIYLCQLVVIAASTFVSSIMIMRLKPKEILSKMS
ncbi:MAG: FtsX-like permease family protein [Lachnospiraceae bacterium]|nr:FtsX-like permease family protein [Lachnospiraceae bacterium]